MEGAGGGHAIPEGLEGGRLFQETRVSTQREMGEGRLSAVVRSILVGKKLVDSGLGTGGIVPTPDSVSRR